MKTATTVLMLLAVSAGRLAAQDHNGTRYMKSSERALDAIRTAYADSRDADVVVLADRALLASPPAEDVGEIHFLRGSALRHLKRPEEALVAFEAASGTGYESADLRMDRALALAAVGRSQDGEQEMEEARRLVQDDPVRRPLFEKQWKDREDKSKKVEIRVRPQFGYDTNIVAVSDDAALTEDADQESFFYGAEIRARWRIVEDRGRSLALGYVNASRAFANESDVSYTDNVLSLTGSVPVTGFMDVGAKLSFGEVFFAEDGHFRTTRSAGPGLAFRIGSHVELSLWGEWSDVDYYIDTPNEQDRDGTYQSVQLKARIELASDWIITPCVAYLDADTEGSDYERREWQPSLTVTAPEVLGIEPSVSVAYVLADFQNPNSLTGFTDERRDRRFAVALTLTVRALEPKLGFAPSITIRFEDWSSNVDEFDFTRWQPMIDASILAWSF